MRHAVVVSALWLVVTGSLTAQGGTASPALDAAAAAMGGTAALLDIRTLVLEGRGEMLSVGQNHTPTAATMYAVTAYRRMVDYRSHRWLVDQTRQPRFPTANTAPQRQRFGVDGAAEGVAYNLSASGTMTRAGAAVAGERLHEFLAHPVGFVMAAHTPGAEVSEERAAGAIRVRLTLRGARYAMYVDPATRLPVRMERITYHPMLGDVAVLTHLSDWAEVGGLRLPMRLRQSYDDLFTLSDIRLGAVRVNDDVGNLAATDSVRAVVQAGAPAPPRVVIDTLAPGVWLLGGQSHHTVAIEQADQLVLIEAPASESRTLAAIEAARGLRAGKPPAIVVNTHHHFDHAGGLRAAASEGLTILTHEDNRSFYDTVVMPRRHFIQQDALARSGRGARIRGVREKEVLRDRDRPVELYHVPNPHAGSMLVAWLPRERLLIQADLYNPAPPNPMSAPVFPFAASLVAFVERRGLPVDRVVGIHGRPVPFTDVQAAARSAP